ncbi:MAG: signal peptidase I [Clostridia bacterium]|nr:signal peptidase I [Clostridia bacterium]
MSRPTARLIKNIIFTILRIILFVFLSLLIGINVYSWNAKKLMGDALPMPFGYGVAVVLSGSMEPELSVDDIVIIKKTDDVQKNDVVVYQSGSSLIIHRVIKIDGDIIQTQGDANNAPDEEINISAVKGKHVGTIPKLGIITTLVQKPVILICLIGGILLLMEMGFKRKKEKENEKLSKAKESVKTLTAAVTTENGDIDLEQLKTMIEKIENELKDKQD